MKVLKSSITILFSGLPLNYLRLIGLFKKVLVKNYFLNHLRLWHNLLENFYSERDLKCSVSWSDSFSRSNAMMFFSAYISNLLEQVLETNYSNFLTPGGKHASPFNFKTIRHKSLRKTVKNVLSSSHMEKSFYCYFGNHFKPRAYCKKKHFIINLFLIKSSDF